MSQLEQVLASHGVHTRPLRLAVALLCHGWQRFDDLVRTTAAPRRSIEELLTALGEDLERDAHALRIRPGAVARYERFRTSAPPETAVSENRELLARVARYVDGVPPPLAALDHVQATAETVLRRALWLDERYDLARARLLFLGDHDLTSLAVRALRPDARLTVVDLDERVLAYVDSVSGGTVTTLHADLRVGLPPGVVASADLVFSDPPYTPEGMGLFAANGVRALADPPLGRIVLAYGYSPRHPALGAQVQRELASLGLTFEAILPDFHRYHGAEAIGSAADLYVCQPTARAKKVKARKGGIYTHGPQSVEARGTKPALLAKLLELAGEGAEVRAADWSASGEPATAAAVDLGADPGPWLLRVLLAMNARQLAVLVPNAHPDLGNAEAQASLSALVAGKYRLRFLRSTPDNKHAVVVATAVDEPVDLLLKAHARLGNVLPGAFPDLHAYRLIDLPRHRIADILSNL